MFQVEEKANRIRLFSFSTPHMRAFHMAWLAFFFCFFAWFAIAPLMPAIRSELHLTSEQVGNIVIASVAMTIVSRLLVGWSCDRFGPRVTHSLLLVLGAIPVVAIGFSHSYTSFLLFRLAIGAIGASFVVTQYHTSVMFAPNCVGTANASSAGWGNMGGGAAQLIMPLVFSGLIACGFTSNASWRIAMILPGIAMLITGILYYFLTQDLPRGNFRELRRRGINVEKKKSFASFLVACEDRRVWALALIYGGCFGVEITIHNVASLYFTDAFHLSLKGAGAIVGAFGMLALFARALGGYLSDCISKSMGMTGRVSLLTSIMLVQGLLLIAFSRMTGLSLAIMSLISFGLFVHMACGATYAVIPFINRSAVGSVAGIVGAGGNVGAVLSGLLFRGALPSQTAFLLLGIFIVAASSAALLVRFNQVDDPESQSFESSNSSALAISALPALN